MEKSRASVRLWWVNLKDRKVQEKSLTRRDLRRAREKHSGVRVRQSRDYPFDTHPFRISSVLMPVPERDCDVPIMIFLSWLPCVSSTRFPPLPEARPGTPDRPTRSQIRQRPNIPVALLRIVVATCRPWKIQDGENDHEDFRYHPAMHQHGGHPSHGVAHRRMWGNLSAETCGRLHLLSATAPIGSTLFPEKSFNLEPNVTPSEFSSIQKIHEFGSRF